MRYLHLRAVGSRAGRGVTVAKRPTEPGWRNWQTQRTQNPPRATSWGFDPPSRHQDKPPKMIKLRRPRPLTSRGPFCVSECW
jgi:hypothetical protein